MYLTFFYSPDEALSANAPDTAAANDHAPVRHISSIPSKDADLQSVADSVVVKWEEETWFTIRYKKQPDFATEVARYDELLQQRTTAGGGSRGLSSDMHELDKEADDALPYVKNFVFGIYGPKLAKDHYGEFGIEHHKDEWELPYDRHRRTLSFQTMIDGLTKNKITTGNYSAAWWTEYVTRYNAALASSEGGAKDISGYVGELNQLRTSIRRTLQSVLRILEGNYPDTFEQVRREWGFLKDRY